MLFRRHNKELLVFAKRQTSSHYLEDLVQEAYLPGIGVPNHPAEYFLSAPGIRSIPPGIICSVLWFGGIQPSNFSVASRISATPPNISWSVPDIQTTPSGNFSLSGEGRAPAPNISNQLCIRRYWLV
ncbi:hypothetical protein [Methylomonas albis]|uniref:Uncharacterized protein n=1 Tax=Methylomonas albis TaxID=1854563 RepID=A0ABR9CYB0_9GAMM|nr:hypothetical protein [Methylomonas albis]MBD9355833.1 hypothetical protein [Methylomonas albis]